MTPADLCREDGKGPFGALLQFGKLKFISPDSILLSSVIVDLREARKAELILTGQRKLRSRECACALNLVVTL